MQETAGGGVPDAWLAVAGEVAGNVWAWLSVATLAAQGYDPEVLAAMEEAGWLAPWHIEDDTPGDPSRGDGVTLGYETGHCVTLSERTRKALAVEIVEEGPRDRWRFGKSVDEGLARRGIVQPPSPLPGWESLPLAPRHYTCPRSNSVLSLLKDVEDPADGPVEAAIAREERERTLMRRDEVEVYDAERGGTRVDVVETPVSLLGVGTVPIVPRGKHAKVSKKKTRKGKKGRRAG